MALTVADVAGYVRRRLDGEPSVPMLTLCNQAGEFLIGAHTWGWLVSNPASLDVVSGRTWISLPTDFGRAHGNPQPTTDSGGYALRWSTPELVTRLQTYNGGFDLLGYIAWNAEVDGTLEPRIVISTSPTSSVADAFLLAYYRRWTELASDTQRVAIPTFMESLYLQASMAMAQGYEEHDLGSREARMTEILSGPEFMLAQRFDGSVQPSLGMMEGGGVQVLAQNYGVPDWHSTVVAGDPS